MQLKLEGMHKVKIIWKACKEKVEIMQLKKTPRGTHARELEMQTEVPSCKCMGERQKGRIRIFLGDQSINQEANHS